MDISLLEKKLRKLDKELHSIMETVRLAKISQQDVVENAEGAWDIDIDSEKFVQELRHSKRTDQL
jgi:hypothetical protein